MRPSTLSLRLAFIALVLSAVAISDTAVSVCVPVADAAVITDSDCNLTPAQIEKGVQCRKDDLNAIRNAPISGVKNLGIGAISNYLMGLVGGLALLYLIYGGIRYMTAGDDLEHIAGAKRTMLYSVVGLVITLLAYVIVTQVLTALYAAD